MNLKVLFCTYCFFVFAVSRRGCFGGGVGVDGLPTERWEGALQLEASDRLPEGHVSLSLQLLMIHVHFVIVGHQPPFTNHQLILSTNTKTTH